jgi:hypothetical protein
MHTLAELEALMAAAAQLPSGLGDCLPEVRKNLVL